MNLRRILTSLAAVAALTLGGHALAQSQFNFNVANNAAQMTYRTQLTATGMNLDLGYTYNRKRGNIANIGLLLVGNAGGGPNSVDAGIGMEFYHAAWDTNYLHHDNSANAVGIGGFVGYRLPTANRVRVALHAYYAPDIIAFDGLTRFLFYGARMEYAVLRNADIYLGFRQVKGDGGAGYYDYDTGFHVGIQLRF